MSYFRRMILTKAAIKQKAKWSYEDYAFLPAELRCEIIDQSLFMAPSPTSDHQNSIGNLFSLIQSFVRKNKAGTVFPAPMDVVLDKNNVVQPDIIFIAKDNSAIIKDVIKGVPDCLIEIISPGYVKYDRVMKYNLYEKFGVKEYWIVDPGNQVVEIFTLESKKYKLHSYTEVKGKVQSKVIKGLGVEVKKIFQKDF
jgi:Uma2 family endonuclease